MDYIYVRGGQPLAGTVTVGGSKNDAVAIMAAALLVEGKTVLHNIPRIADVDTLRDILRHLGASSQIREDGALEIDASRLATCETPHDLVRQMRASFNVLGALLARFKEASVAMPGGCDIGARPVNFHIKGLQQLGCHLRLEHGVYVGEAPKLVGARLYLDFPSAGATQHLMITACMAQGRTVIQNCAVEPEIVDLARFLNQCGARISGAGTPEIVIDGVERLHSTEFEIIPDRLQAGTYALAAAITGGDVTIRNAIPDHCRSVLAKLTDTGVEVISEPNAIRVRRTTERIHPTDIRTMPHPGFPTDMQQPFAALLSIADGVSVLSETVYESRFRYTTELERLGARIRVEGRTAKITGVPRLTGAPVTCTDLRGGAALIVAALAAEGVTEIAGLEHIDRGYEDLTPNLQSLGARLTRGAELSVAGGLRVCSA